MQMHRFEEGAAAGHDPCPFKDARFNDTTLNRLVAQV